MFKSKEVNPNTNAILVPAPMDHLDPLREHRFFCPWKNGLAQRNSGAKPPADGEEDKPGWELLVQVLRNDAFLRSRMNRQSGHGRSKSALPGDAMPPNVLQGVTETARRPTTAASGAACDTYDPVAVPGTDDDEMEDEATRTAKDKERWARLRKVKSLFNNMNGNKPKRSGSRPGTGHSSIRPRAE
jgi:hypothetical protein